MLSTPEKYYFLTPCRQYPPNLFRNNKLRAKMPLRHLADATVLTTLTPEIRPKIKGNPLGTPEEEPSGPQRTAIQLPERTPAHVRISE